MRAVIQRVSRASVSSEGRVLGRIGPGLLVLVGFARGDDDGAVSWMAEKIVRLRIFPDGAGKMNRSVADVGGGVLVVSQFTLLGDARKGTRPGFSDAAAPAEAAALFDELVLRLRRDRGIRVETGTFGAAMEVELVNDGPVTLLLDRPAGA